MFYDPWKCLNKMSLNVTRNYFITASAANQSSSKDNRDIAFDHFADVGKMIGS